MAHQSTHHHHPSLNPIPQIHPLLPTHLAAPIKPNENDNDGDDVVFLEAVPKVPHTPEEYDPECNCSTCQLVKKLLAECTCGECRGQQSNEANQAEGQTVQSSKKVTVHSEANAQPSKSSIPNNAASTSEHISGNDHDDRSINSTSDFLLRSFDDESGDSKSADNKDDQKIGQTSDDNYRSAPENAFPRPSTSKCLKRSHPKRSNKTTAESKKRHKCRCCSHRFSTMRALKRHFRVIHQQLKPYYCKWTKCDFVSGRHDKVIDHITVKHFKNRKNANKAKVYIGKRKLAYPLLESSLKAGGLKRKRRILWHKSKGDAVCPLCGRKVYSCQFNSHLRHHVKPGFRCNWSECGFFYAKLSEAKKHVCADHLHAETTNSQQIYRHLVKVVPRTSKIEKVAVSKSSNSTDHSQSSTSSSVTNSRDNDDEEKSKDCDSPFKCPKCEKTFATNSKLRRHCRAVHQQWKPFYCRWPKCHFVAGIHDKVVQHANRKHFKSQNRQKARKYVGKRDEAPPNDPVLKQIAQTSWVCAQCGRHLRSNYTVRHLRSHKNIGFRCTWTGCGFFYSQLFEAKKHICTVHLKVEMANSQQTNRHLVKVNPKTCKTTKVESRLRRQKANEANVDNAEDEKDSDNDDDGNGNEQ